MGALYKPGPIEPIVLTGEYVLAQFLTNFQLYQVAYVEPLPPSPDLNIDLLANVSGGLGAGKTTSQAVSSASQLNMSNGDLGQFRWFVIDDGQITVYEPGQNNPRYMTLNNQLHVDPYTHLIQPYDESTEIFVFGNQTSAPYFRVYNPTNETLLKCRILPYGFRYVLSGENGTVTGKSESLKPLAKFTAIKDAITYRKTQGINFTVVPVGGWAGGTT